MNLSGIRRATLLGKVLRAPLALLPPSTVVPVLQGPLRGRRWVIGASTHGCWLGSYEHDKQRRFARAIQPRDVVFDVGANVGFYTLIASDRVGPRGKVFAFEPLPRNLAFLHRHLELNRVSNVEVVAAAVTDASGSARFSEALSPSMGCLSEGGALQVRAVGLDALVFDGALPAPDLIKMDIEGGEVRALAGARRLLRHHHPRLFLATHGPDIHRACCELLIELGYALEALDDRPWSQTDEVLATASRG